MATAEANEMNIVPPTPPTSKEEMDFMPGEFEYIKNNSEKRMLQTAYKAITLTENWNYIKNDPGPNGFMWSGDKRARIIYNKIEELGYTGHSACSFGCILRDMQYIGQYGEKSYKEMYLNTQQKKR